MTAPPPQESTDPWVNGKIYTGLLTGGRIDDDVLCFVSFETDDILFGYDPSSMKGIKAQYPAAEWPTNEWDDTMLDIEGEYQDENGDFIEIFLTVEKNDDGTITYQERSGYKQTDTAPGIPIESKQATLIEIGTGSVPASWQGEGIFEYTETLTFHGNFGSSSPMHSFISSPVRFTQNDILFSNTSFREFYPDAKLTIFGNDTELYMVSPAIKSLVKGPNGLEPGTIAHFIKAKKTTDGTPVVCHYEEYYTYDREENGST